MTWAEFKAMVEAAGVQDEDRVEVFEKRPDRSGR